MRQKLLQKAGLLGFVLLTTGVFLSSCIEEPNPPVLGRVTSEVRFLHAIPDAPLMDIWVDGDKVLSGVPYKAESKYLVVNSGNRFLRVVPAGGDTSSAVFRRMVSVRSLTKMTMAFHGSTADPALLITQERFTYADETSELVDSSDVKLINLANTGTTYRLQHKLSDGEYEPLVAAVAGSLSPYIRVPSGISEFSIADNGSGARVSEFTHTIQKPGYRYSFVVVGNVGGLECLVLQDEPKP